MSKIWFTSDTHFGHQQNFLYEPRGFSNTEEMNKTIIDNWNSVVAEDDEVYHLGDVMLNDNDAGIACLKQLNGKIHIIRGNHDTEARIKLYKESPNVVEVCDGKFFRYGKYHFYLSHYPCLTSNFDDDKPLKARTISLCGHSHTQDKFNDFNKGLIYHCEMDAHDCHPVDIDTIIEDCKIKVSEYIKML